MNNKRNHINKSFVIKLNKNKPFHNLRYSLSQKHQLFYLLIKSQIKAKILRENYFKILTKE